MVRTVYAYVDQDTCPICHRLTPKLEMMEIEGEIEYVEVPVNKAKGGRIMQKYVDICNNLFGGGREVPVVAMDDLKNFFIPARRTRGGKMVGEKESLEEVINNVIKMIKREIKKPKEEFPPTHEYMLNNPMGGFRGR